MFYLLFALLYMTEWRWLIWNMICIIKNTIDSILGPWIAKRRAPKVRAKYAEIGGGSPILDWTRKQGSALVHLLNERRPESAPHQYYVGFRYAQPLLESALDQMKR